jgi:hypothetical protein
LGTNLLVFLPKRLQEFWNFWFSAVQLTDFAILLENLAKFSISQNLKIKPYLLGHQILDQTLEKVISKIYISIWRESELFEIHYEVRNNSISMAV